MERSADREGDPMPQIHLREASPLKIPRKEPLASLQDFFFHLRQLKAVEVFFSLYSYGLL